ncbi:MAG: hypothetical protein MRQ13_03980 [Candidatus Midichloria sp.]|nr:hypothetical protein [Candidatus Midichloria sp.]
MIDNTISGTALMLRGSGEIGCNDAESCRTPTLATPNTKFCIYNDLGLW